MGESDLRASDADRDQAAATLREHFGSGRLDQDELDERVNRAYAARTMGDLSALLADLPKLPATRAEQKREVAERRRHLQRRVLQESGGGLCLFAVCTAIWVASGAESNFWPVWVLTIVLIPLVKGGWALYGPAPDLDQLEAKLDRHADKRQGGRRHTRP